MKNILNIIKDSNHGFSIFDQKLLESLGRIKEEIIQEML